MRKKVVKTLIGLLIIIIIAIVCVIILNPFASLEFPEDMPTSNTLLNSAILGGNYLINVTWDNGIFLYEYDPVNDIKSDSYNILRHAGTIYSMLELYDITGDEELLSSAEKAISYLLSFEKPYGNGSGIVYDNAIKLGGNGLAILALAEHARITGDMQHLSSMQHLAIYIKESQNDSGGFLSKRYYSTEQGSDFESLYYPGEAILSLCRLYALDKNETWLDVAEKGALYLINLRSDIPTTDLVHDHWLVIALNELYRYRDNQKYFDHSMRLAESIMSTQTDGIIKTTNDPDRIGSYSLPRSAPTATRTEALIAAFHLANDFGNDLSKTQRILNAISLGIQFQLRTQFTEDNMQNVLFPEKAIGGFHDSLTNYNIRIDYVQHNICSILGLYEII